LKQDEGHRVARYVLAAKALKENKFDLAAEQFAAAKKGPIWDLTTQLTQAWIDLAKGRADAAFESLDQVKDADWSRLYQRYHRALLADVAGRVDIAKAAYADAFDTSKRTLRIAD